MNKAFFCLLFLVGDLALAQETKLIQKKGKDDWGREYYEEYSVLVTDKKIKHGSYAKFEYPLVGTSRILINGGYNFGKKEGYWQLYFTDGKFPNQINHEGYYRNDLKDSLWVSYFPEEKGPDVVINKSTGVFEIRNLNSKVRKKGVYAAGKKVGVWNYYTRDGDLSQAFDFGKDRLLSDHSLLDSSKWKNHEPILIGHEIDLLENLASTFDFFELMDRVNIFHLNEGRLVLEFSIMPDGTIAKIHEKENTIHNMKVESNAYKSVESVSKFWIPKFTDGRPIESIKAITFLIGSETHTSYWDRNNFSNKKQTIGINCKILVN